jgi:hypothetical protein
MKFFNKKEQVIDIQLTQYGKRLLSKGRFKPYYYAFFDDGILYDSQYGGTEENQNDSQARIIKETPSIQAQYNFGGVESTIKRANQLIRSTPEEKSEQPGVLDTLDQGQYFQQSEDKLYSLNYMLGTSTLANNLTPVWSVDFLNGQISGSVIMQNTSSCTNQIINIPEITPLPITYKTKINNVSAAELSNYEPGARELDGVYGTDPAQVINVFEVNSALLLQVQEKNSNFHNENFDIEVYEIKEEVQPGVSLCDDVTKREVLIPLYFTKKESMIENGIIKDAPPPSYQNQNLSLDPSYVEYYMNIEVDNEINPNILCDKTNDYGEGIFSQRVLNCDVSQKQQKPSVKNLFGTDATLEDVEGCD